MARSPLDDARDRLHDQARIEALALRREAMNDFWRGAGAALADPATQTLRASARLLARWRRHRLARQW